MNSHDLDSQKVPHWFEILPSNNIILSTRNKGFDFARGCFGRVMMSVIRSKHSAERKPHLVQRGNSIMECSGSGSGPLS
jgi:hypothetical protein